VLDYDIDFFDDLQVRFEDCPPLRRMVAAFMGIKPKEKPSTDYAELLAMFPSGMIK
jgi:hypothetical protein